MKIKFRLVLLVLLAQAITCDSRVHAQTLTESLLAEPADKLVLQARERGDIVRGAILFHQGNINCAKCHRPASENDRLGPDLSKLDKEVTDESLVQSVLEPSKIINKDYQTQRVLTDSGRVINGLLVSQTKQEVVLRDAKNIDNLIRISRDEIEEITDVKVSVMPKGLADQLKDRKQFLDLLRYVIDLRERGPAADSITQTTASRRKLPPELHGLVLIRNLGCVACHKSDSVSKLPAARQGPNLKWSANWLDSDHLAKFIADPNELKPGTSMPGLLGHLSPEQKTDSARAIVHFLKSVAGERPAVEKTIVDQNSVQNGFDLFHTVGCVACHAPRDKSAIEKQLGDSVPLGELAKKYDSSALVVFLENPHAARPSGRMPNMQLTYREASDLANYLLQNGKREPKAAWDSDDRLVAQGKQLFKQLNCAACHSGIIDAETTSRLAGNLSSLNSANGCLSGKAGKWPDYTITDQQRTSIQAAIAKIERPLDQQQTIDFTLASFRCVACHHRDNLGGVSSERRQYFQTTNLNLGEQGRIPPTLTGVGAKLNPKWMRDVLVNGRSVRPYMKTRMPKFGETNIGHMIDLFQACDQLAGTEFAKVKDPKEARKNGWKIAGREGLNCAACHTYQYKLADTMPAVDLTEMAERLQKDWFYQYMLAPQTFSPNTVMPSFWPGGKAIRKDIAGEPKDQIEALWQYLLEGRQARAPSGVIREPLEIVVTDEARMLRRKYSEIGKRGIGVGYPGGVNIAYDAQQMRLATLWRGKFVDPGGVWYGQGHGNVRAMGSTIQLPKGPELYDPLTPTEINFDRPKNHRFQGYVLDDKRRPTMRYIRGSVAVEDYLTEFQDSETGQTQLRRTIKFTADENHEGLSFRLADGDFEAENDRTYRIGNRLGIRVVSDQKPETTDGTLAIPLTLTANQTKQIVIEYLLE